jgi:peptidoglycan/xylan/chitin deacetylase (PgdA/CDA1 family)
MARPLRNLGLRPKGAHLPILMYHSISADPESEVAPYYRVCTSPARFAEQMQWLADGGWRGVTLSDAYAALQRQGPDLNKLVAITFDDGFSDFYTDALPTLMKHGFAATMYVPTAYIGKQRKAFKSHHCLTWEELRALSDVGVEIGSHTVSHPRLAALTWREIETELQVSKATIEGELQLPVLTFAYPYAFPQEDRHFATRFREMLRRIDYRTCVTTAIGRADGNSDALHLPRLPANSADDCSLFTAKLDGAYDWVGLPQKLMKAVRGKFGVARRPIRYSDSQAG